MKKGYIQIYTGNGKGKTTAALGLALRAAGRGLKIAIIQFMKDFPYGEIKALERFQNQITMQRFGDDTFVLRKTPPSAEDVAKAKEGMRTALRFVQDERLDLVILDEICVAIYFKLITTVQVMDLFHKKAEHIELVLTGRYCPESLQHAADLVTDMREIKHYYQQGIKARPGIES